MNEKKGVGLAVASMVLGIVSLLLGCCFWYISLPAALVSLILAAVRNCAEISCAFRRRIVCSVQGAQPQEY